MSTAVKLIATWFAPGGVRYREGDYPAFPDHLIPALPSSATVSDGEFMIPVKEFLETKAGAALAEKYPIEGPKSVGAPVRERAPDTDVVSRSVPANAEGADPNSPKSSGPETTALPSDTSKAGPVTASGTEAKKDEPVVPMKK